MMYTAEEVKIITNLYSELQINRTKKYCQTIIMDCILDMAKQKQNCCYIPLEDYNYNIIKGFMMDYHYKVEKQTESIIKISW